MLGALFANIKSQVTRTVSLAFQKPKGSTVFRVIWRKLALEVLSAYCVSKLELSDSHLLHYLIFTETREIT